MSSASDRSRDARAAGQRRGGPSRAEQRARPGDEAALAAIRADIERRFGLVPSFFMLARGQPAIVGALFDLAQFAYLDSPLPSEFKERLFTYLSRFCAVPYCLARHCGFLLGRGRVAGDPSARALGVRETLDMLGVPVPDPEEARSVLDRMRAAPGLLDGWPETGSPLEEAIFRASSLIFLRPVQYQDFLTELRRVLGEDRYNHLMLFLGFIRLAHFWTEVHPELGMDPDIERLMEEQRALADWMAGYRDRVQSELAERISTEIEYLDALRAHAREIEAANEALRKIVVERTRAAEAAEAASRAKSNFLAIMSHELRTPLNAILGYAALLDDQIVGPLNVRQQDQVERVIDSGRHLLGLIEQILSLSRIEAGREEVRADRFDAAALAREVAAMVEPLARDKRLDLVADAPAAPTELTSDPGKVRQILLNLLSNAVKFTEAGAVRLRVWQDRGDVVFQVSDTGPGIPPEDRERIFHPFEQVEVGTTRTKAGAGLGLSVSLELARLLGGTLDLESEVGRGSTFTVRLPAAASPSRDPGA